MRLCVVSDTHRHRHELLQAVKNSQPLDAVLHAGDETSDVDWLKEKVDWDVYGVAGNWDIAGEYPEYMALTQYGPSIFLVHGHTFGVKDGVGSLLLQARSAGADIVVFGHTHQAVSLVRDGKLFLNPGSLSQPRGRTERTYAVLDIDLAEDGQAYDVRAQHFTLHGESLADLILRVQFATNEDDA
ncbi:metallophosphoesterase family protein [Alicyclobacillus sp. SO9]|uniref:metallophosphoesterase family protein n=1 Tax=Alicyclobacillus sp. SO9 TaxID=2665646 RepID=UPI0018E796A8|nr:metallophosphoesterase [Alicyclobacillus sp. SO9]QQE77032.1 metallophosphoesterase [Alicyclobacillus sp. SO9]